MPSTSTSVSNIDHDENVDNEGTVTVSDPGVPSDHTANTTQINAGAWCNDQAVRIQQLEVETKRLTGELLVQQRAAVYYNEKCKQVSEVGNYFTG